MSTSNDKFVKLGAIEFCERNNGLPKSHVYYEYNK